MITLKTKDSDDFRTIQEVRQNLCYYDTEGKIKAIRKHIICILIRSVRMRDKNIRIYFTAQKDAISAVVVSYF